MAGEVDASEILAELIRADVFVTASESEAMPMSVLEAAAAGLPVIASDIPAHRWLLGDSALYFPVGDYTALADALTRLQRDTDLWMRLARAGPTTVSPFSMARFVSSYVELVGRVHDAA
jgi:glycosyltransferase involved in cell wall biosynthesis